MKEYICIYDEDDMMYILNPYVAQNTELIRCKDCKCWKPSMTDVTEHVCHWGGFRKDADDFCSWAERKEE